MSLQLNIIVPSFDPATVGGAGTAMIELIKEFLREEPQTRLYFNHQVAKLYPEWSDHIVEVPTGAHLTARPPTSSLLRLQFLGSSVLPADGICWFPFGFITPATWKGRGVTTIHDTLECDLPHGVPAAQRVFRKWIIPRTAKRSKIVTISEFSKRQLRHHYGIESTVIPHAPIPLPAPSKTKVPARPYVFFPANAWPHKNHAFLIETWVKHSELRDLALVFTLSSGMHQLVAAIAEGRANGVDIVVLGHVTSAELAGLYANAHCAVFPSLYEGFGLPMQEALLLNCPIVASRNGSLPETVKADYPLLLPLDTEAWATAIASNPRSRCPDWSTSLRARTWQDCAREYLDAFSSV